MDHVKPFLKWVGGKTQIIKEVIGLFPTEMDNYFEPFLGGGSVLLALLSEVRRGAIQVAGHIFASDLNPNLIGLYRNVQARPDALIAAVRSLVIEFEASVGDTVNRKPTTLAEAKTSPESYYYWIRAKFNALPAVARSSVAASAMFLFLNKTCFRGVYREGPNGFNVPYGHYTNVAVMDEDHIKAVSELIKDVVFTCESFEEAISPVGLGDFVYADPPYAPMNATSFVGYNAGGFHSESHGHLFELCRGLVQKDALFLLSNADVPLVKEAFPGAGFETKIISCRRAIQSNDPSARANEVLIRPRQ